MSFQSYDIGRYSYFIEKIGKSTSDLISDRQQQVVSFTLLADAMELRSSFLFVSKNKYGSDVDKLIETVIKIIQSPVGQMNLLLIFFFIYWSGICVLDKSKSDARQKFAQ